MDLITLLFSTIYLSLSAGLTPPPPPPLTESFYINIMPMTVPIILFDNSFIGYLFHEHRPYLQRRKVTSTVLLLLFSPTSPPRRIFHWRQSFVSTGGKACAAISDLPTNTAICSTGGKASYPPEERPSHKHRRMFHSFGSF